MHYKYYNPNPGGKYVGDCVLRAICKTEGLEWETAFVELMTEAFRLYDMPSSNYVWGSYLKSKGYVRYNLPDTCPECYTLKQFCEEYNQVGSKFIVATGTHAVAVCDGNYYDSWDSGDEIVIYYWVKLKGDN